MGELVVFPPRPSRAAKRATGLHLHIGADPHAPAALHTLEAVSRQMVAQPALMVPLLQAVIDALRTANPHARASND